MKTAKDIKSNDPRYPLWKFFNDEHGLVLLDGEMDDIIHAVESLSQLTETKRPSDEEIKAEAERHAEKIKGYRDDSPNEMDEDHTVKQTFIDACNWLRSQVEVERFKMPESKQVIDIAILFNDGKVDHKRLADMVAMTDFILDRLPENGDIMIPCKKEEQ